MINRYIYIKKQHVNEIKLRKNIFNVIIQCLSLLQNDSSSMRFKIELNHL